jgi:hypothetical protein
MRYLLVIIMLAVVLITAGCTTTTPPVTPQETITIVPTSTPEPTVTRPLPGMDPIIGSWDNGLVFNADGSVGSDGLTFWKPNEMEKNSYFVTTETRAMKDAGGNMRIDPSASATEWIYNPAADIIYQRGASAGVHRILPGMKTAAPAPTVT